MVDKTKTQGFDISKKSALVLGCGGLGCNAALHLGGAGIGKLFVCDFDTVSESNLNRQLIYTIGDIGLPKAEVMKKFLLNYAPDCETVCINKKITEPKELDFAKECDVIILAVDNSKARRVAQDFCFENKIPLVNGGIDGFFGTAYLYLPGKTACLECAGLLSSKKDIYAVSSTAGIIGALEASLAIRCLLLQGEDFAGKIFCYDNEEISSLKVSAMSDCKRCIKNKKKK